MREARYYQKEGEKVHCLLCPQDCHIAEGKKGLCGVREAEQGKLYSLNYRKYAAAAVDPVEKKPLYHFFPGCHIFSLGTIGCNLHCSFCQNWTLSRSRERALQDITPDKVVSILRQKASSELVGVAYTYNEPFVWFEFVLECSQELSSRGYQNVLVTNGLVNPGPLEELLPFIDAMNIDVKAFNKDFYRKTCGGFLEEVLQTVERAVKDCHVELTYLVIPTLNDDLSEIDAFIQWVAALDNDIPVHFSRYYPQHEMKLPPTPLSTMEKIGEKAKEKLHHVYLGNMPGGKASRTCCPSCRQVLLERKGSYLYNQGLTAEKKCSSCLHPVKIVGKICSP